VHNKYHFLVKHYTFFFILSLHFIAIATENRHFLTARLTIAYMAWDASASSVEVSQHSPYSSPYWILKKFHRARGKTQELIPWKYGGSWRILTSSERTRDCLQQRK